ncbi:hypothetical protein CLU81_0190 [Flavobacterium sp. 9]|nr:hypothetical protein CLU81_0190 [Flavobacterium sp. 9]
MLSAVEARVSIEAPFDFAQGDKLCVKKLVLIYILFLGRENYVSMCY